MPELTRIRHCEEITFNSWPALATLYVDGWLARFANGVTGRSNSLNALCPGGRPLDDILAAAAPAYAARHLPMMLRLTPLCPPGTREAVIAKGWRIEKESHVFGCDVTRPVIDPAVIMSSVSTADWRNAYQQANPRFDAAGMETLANIHAALVPRASFAKLVEEGENRALGMAVVERETVSLHEIATLGAARGRGLGKRLVSSLLAWGAAHGAKEAILQVQADNTPAIRLYRSLGFTRLYDYCYAVAP